MLNKPKFKIKLRVEAVGSESLFLLAENDSILLSGSLYQLLVPLIDGQHTVDEIVNILQDRASSTEIYYALMRMEQKGYIVESDDVLPSTIAMLCDTLHLNSKNAYHRLQITKVAVKSFGNLPSDSLISLLRSLHLQVAEEGDLTIVLTDDYLREELDIFNQKAINLSQPWMPIQPLGNTVSIGPIFHPGQTGCWECLARRLRGNRPVEAFIQRRQNIATPLTPPLNSLPSTYQTALSMAATEILKWVLQGENKQLEGILVSYNTLSLETQKHVLVKRPQCPICGEMGNGINRKPLPIVLGRRKKTFITDGGHRCVAPEETLRKYQHHISPITGVVRSLEKVFSEPNSSIHTYAAQHHFVTLFDDINGLRQNLSGRSAGKGKTEAQAKASAFCEAIERYSAVFQGDEIRQKGSYRNLGEVAIHPNRCMNFSQGQYNRRHEWNAKCYGWFQKVPEPFDEEREIEWTPVWSLTDRTFKYLPTAYCYFGYPQTFQPDCWADSNGCAAGNTLEEAILQGFMELVERDSVALWWYNRVKRARVDLDSFNEPYFQALKDYYQTLHRDLWVLDITSDLNIPTFAAITRRNDSLRDSYASRAVEDIVLGYGAHFDPKIAVQRALTEVNQILPAVLSANADGSTDYRTYEPLAINWWKTATLENQPYLVPDESLPAKVYADYPQRWSDDLREDVMTCQQIVEKHGMEMLVLDLTRPDIGLKVVKTIVPGMCHLWKRLGSRRLYEVPVRLGWLKEPTPESQLNPFPMWM